MASGKDTTSTAATAQQQAAPASGHENPTSNAVDPAMLEEDDEFEDFPVDDWPAEETEMPGSSAHLWEESWDDDDTSEEFSKQLKEELDKVKSGK